MSFCKEYPTGRVTITEKSPCPINIHIQSSPLKPITVVFTLTDCSTFPFYKILYMSVQHVPTTSLIHLFQSLFKHTSHMSIPSNLTSLPPLHHSNRSICHSAFLILSKSHFRSSPHIVNWTACILDFLFYSTYIPCYHTSKKLKLYCFLCLFHRNICVSIIYNTTQFSKFSYCFSLRITFSRLTHQSTISA